MNHRGHVPVYIQWRVKEHGHVFSEWEENKLLIVASKAVPPVVTLVQDDIELEKEDAHWFPEQNPEDYQKMVMQPCTVDILRDANSSAAARDGFYYVNRMDRPQTGRELGLNDLATFPQKVREGPGKPKKL